MPTTSAVARTVFEKLKIAQEVKKRGKRSNHPEEAESSEKSESPSFCQEFGKPKVTLDLRKHLIAEVTSGARGEIVSPDSVNNFTFIHGLKSMQDFYLALTRHAIPVSQRWTYM